MSDVVLSPTDRTLLCELLAEFFCDTTLADALLSFVRYPLASRPNFEGDALNGWAKVFVAFDEAPADQTPYSELLVGVSRVYPSVTRLVELVMAYDAGTRITTSCPTVLVIGESSATEESRWSRELAAIQTAEKLGCIQVATCSGGELGHELIREVAPQILHVNGRCDGQKIHFETGAVPATTVRDCLDRCLTEHELRLEGLVLGSGHGPRVDQLYHPVTDCVVTHDEHLTDELGIRFSAMLYKLVPTAPSFGAAVDAAHLLVYDQAYPHARRRPGRHLKWGAPAVEPQPPGSARRRFPLPAKDIRLDNEQRVEFEELVIGLVSTAESTRQYLQHMGFSQAVRHQFSVGPNWPGAFDFIENGGVTGAAPYRLLLERLVKKFPANPAVRKFAEEHLQDAP